MKFYLAPMEGVTGHIYRNAYADFFESFDKYFAPFISPQSFQKITSRDTRDIIPEVNKAKPLIPQILTKHASDFIDTAKCLKDLGYTEVNLNLGCPSGTVTSKGKGAGFLAFPDELDAFLYEIFEKVDMKISVKTRLGMTDPGEFERIMEIYNKYSMEELIIHPRVRADMYRNTPNLEVFSWAYEISKNPVVYNGDIFTLKAYEKIVEKYPTLDTIMLGRGSINNPDLVHWLRTGKSDLSKEKFMAFHDRLLEDYTPLMFGDRNLLFRMKELWYYWSAIFPEGAKALKKIRKANRLVDYYPAVKEMLETPLCVEAADGSMR